MTKSLRSALSAIAVLIAVLVTLPAVASANVQVGSSGWLWGNPLPQGNSLHDIAFMPGTTTGYAVGDFGTILKTVDAGNTWSGLPAGTFSNLTRVQVAPDGTIVAGGGCVMRVSTNGGTSFTRITAFTASEATCPHSVIAFSYVSKSVGYNLLDDGEVQATTDGGESVLSSTNGVPGTAGSPTGGSAKPTDITFLADGMTGFASTSDGHIYKTTNGAQSWLPAYTGNRSILRMQFLDANNGFAVGEGGLFLTTVDGGVTWVPHDTGTGENLTGVNCISTTSCVASAVNGDIVVKTADAGATFALPHPSVEVNAVGFASPTQVVGVGNNGGTTVSADGGTTYTPIGGPLPSTAYNRLRSGGTNNTAYVVGPAGALADTTDGGQTWKPAKVNGAGNVVDVSFPTPNAGWALDSTGALYTTANGGTSWKPIDTGSTAKANAVYASSSSHVMVIGPRGIRVSTNTGNDFTAVPKIASLPLTDVDKAGSALIVYGPQDILESTNGGASFKAVLKPGKYKKVHKKLVNHLEVERVDFVSAKVGFVLDEDGRVWTTANTGKTWTELTGTGTEEALGMAWSSAKKGYLIIDRFGAVTKDSGFVLHTSDGGLSWHPQFIVSDPIQPKGIASGGSTDYLLSAHSNLLSTTKGGDQGKSSTLTIKPSVASLPKAKSIQVTGTLKPAVGFEQVVVSMRPAGSLEWTEHIAKVDSNGKFTTTWTGLRKGANLFVAQWQGDFLADGAGTKVLTVTVGKKPKTKSSHKKH